MIIRMIMRTRRIKIQINKNMRKMPKMVNQGNNIYNSAVPMVIMTNLMGRCI